MYDTMPLLLEIPEEILFDEILVKLPVKSLLRFKCVSKSWLSLIESDRFIKAQLLNSAKSPRVFMVHNYGEKMSGCSLQWMLKKSKEEVSDPTKHKRKPGVVMGCCNGVVCFDGCRGCRGFLFWNPATRVSVELPHPNDGGGPGVLVKFGFGWDESTGAYKVFVVYREYKHHVKRGSVYSSKTNSWRTISPGFCSPAGGPGVFLRGNLHWIDEHHFKIECFDLEREELGRIEMPVSVYNPRLWLGDIGGSLSLFIDLKKSLEIWVMKEYGLKDSWLKILTVPTTSLPKPMNYAVYPLFGEVPNGEGEIFVIYRGK